MSLLPRSERLFLTTLFTFSLELLCTNTHTYLLTRYKLNIWDVGGQTTLRSYWRNYYEQTEGLIWVIDSTDIRRLDDCKAELHKLLREERLAGATLLIFANKQDISGAQTSEDLLRALELDKMGQRHWRIVSCSGITGDGVQKGLNWIVEDVAARIYMFD